MGAGDPRKIQDAGPALEELQSDGRNSHTSGKYWWGRMETVCSWRSHQKPCCHASLFPGPSWSALKGRKSKTTCRPLIVASLGIILLSAPQAHLPQSNEQENVEREHPSQPTKTTAASEYKLTLYSGKALKTLLHFVIPSHRDSWTNSWGSCPLLQSFVLTAPC